VPERRRQIVRRRTIEIGAQAVSIGAALYSPVPLRIALQTLTSLVSELASRRPRRAPDGRLADPRIPERRFGQHEKPQVSSLNRVSAPPQVRAAEPLAPARSGCPATAVPRPRLTTPPVRVTSASWVNLWAVALPGGNQSVRTGTRSPVWSARRYPS
jgi:hypothetical protein